MLLESDRVFNREVNSRKTRGNRVFRAKHSTLGRPQSTRRNVDLPRTGAIRNSQTPRGDFGYSLTSTIRVNMRRDRGGGALDSLRVTADSAMAAGWLLVSRSI